MKQVCDLTQFIYNGLAGLFLKFLPNPLYLTTRYQNMLATEINWHWFEFGDLSPAVLYDYLSLREKVFIIEQQCLYADLDGLDQSAMHLLGFTPQGQLAAGLRVLPAGLKYPEFSLGRIVVAQEFRRNKIGRTLLQEALNFINENHNNPPVRIQAQAYLAAFYESLGFVQLGTPYDDMGIAHVDMLLTP